MKYIIILALAFGYLSAVDSHYDYEDNHVKWQNEVSGKEYAARHVQKTRSVHTVYTNEQKQLIELFGEEK